MKLDAIPFLVDKILKYIESKRELSELQKKKVTYGLRTIFYNLEKLLIVIIFAIVFSIEKEVIFMLIPANLIKRYIYGVHAKSSIMCSFVSVGILAIGVLLFKCINLDNRIIILMIILGAILIMLYAPADTAKLPLIKSETRRKLKKKALLSFGIMSIFAILIKNFEVKYFVMYGMISQIIMTTPLIYRIFNEPYKNYLKYEGKV